MQSVTQLLVARGLAVTLFEFNYMAARRTGGARRPPPRAEKLTAEYVAMLHAVSETVPKTQRLWIGGKSLGGRVASLIADAEYGAQHIAGLVCFGYPFHPIGKPENLRTDHLETLTCPALILQGDRDPFGNRREVEQLKLSPLVTVHWIPDGDHDLGPRGNSGFTRKANLASATEAVATFVGQAPIPPPTMR